MSEQLETRKVEVEIMGSDPTAASAAIEVLYQVKARRIRATINDGPVNRMLIEVTGKTGAIDALADDWAL
jgi:ribosomal protein L23